MVKTEQVKMSNQPIKKPSITKNKINVEVIPQYNREFLQQFKKVYASIIYDMCNSHTFHDDSACFFESMCQRYTTDRFKYFTYIYQPTFDRCEGTVEVANFIIKIKNYTLTKEDKNQMKIIQKEVESILIEDFKNIMKITNNTWFHPISEFCFNDIMEIIKPMEEIGKNKFKIKYKPFNGNYYFCGGFDPVNIHKVFENDAIENIEYNQRFNRYNFKHQINIE